MNRQEMEKEIITFIELLSAEMHTPNYFIERLKLQDDKTIIRCYVKTHAAIDHVMDMLNEIKDTPLEGE